MRISLHKLLQKQMVQMKSMHWKHFFSSCYVSLPASFVIPAAGALPLRAWTRRVDAVECCHLHHLHQWIYNSEDGNWRSGLLIFPHERERAIESPDITWDLSHFLPATSLPGVCKVDLPVQGLMFLAVARTDRAQKALAEKRCHLCSYGIILLFHPVKTSVVELF